MDPDISPLDFPQIWQRPSAASLLTCLQKLREEPPIWNPSTSRRIILADHARSACLRKEIAAYLGTLISSDLGWLSDDEQRDAVWDAASRRLSERCGRAGMGEITRRWPFEGKGVEGRNGFELIVREPPITGDALGFKTWGSSYFLARLLDRIADRSLSHLLAGERRAAVLELGSGTGLCGMAAAAIWRTHVFLSDLPGIVPNLSFNIDKNREVIEALGGKVDAGALTWGGFPEGDDESFEKKNQFKLILIADPMYDDDHPELLSLAIQEHLMQTDDARVLIMVPLRDETTRKLLATFRDNLARAERSLACLEEDSVMGQDDWDEDEETPGIECWWGIFGSATK